jgi:hypothetical protein
MTMILRVDNAPCGPSPGKACNVPHLFFVRNMFFKFCSLAGSPSGVEQDRFLLFRQQVTIYFPHLPARYFPEWKFRPACADTTVIDNSWRAPPAERTPPRLNQYLRRHIGICADRLPWLAPHPAEDQRDRRPWRATMECFIRQQNLERFRRLLAQSPTEPERRQIQKLLAEEEAKEREAATRSGGA